MLTLATSLQTWKSNSTFMLLVPQLPSRVCFGSYQKVVAHQGVGWYAPGGMYAQIPPKPAGKYSIHLQGNRNAWRGGQEQTTFAQRTTELVKVQMSDPQCGAYCGVMQRLVAVHLHWSLQPGIHTNMYSDKHELSTVANPRLQNGKSWRASFW